ncbi:MAG: hypothetical protein IJ908_10850 [Fibrobacter sp.]|jgi:hypothetical protein|nr:hypothetical protein [Fibrobacter sp.]MBR6122334.1 hypothetical protein [Candidatus Saccharibacteria bacterium]
MEQNDGLLSSLFKEKKNLIKLLFSAVILAFGINLFANYIYSIFHNNPNIILLLSISTILSIILYITYLFFKKSKRIISIDSVIIIEKSTKDIVSVPRYRFSEDLAKNLKSALVENEAFHDYWYNELFSNEKEYGLFNKSNNAVQLLDEAIEYTILNELSIASSSYFEGHFEEKNKYIRTYTRDDVSEYLLKNRILNLLSTPFSDRPMFNKQKSKSSHSTGEIITIMGPNGIQYNKFHLTLPQNSKIKRPEYGVLEISNNAIELKIKIKNEGFSTSTPRSFEEYYLGYKRFTDVDTKMVNITVFYKVKFFTMFSNKKKEYNEWGDYFLSSLVNHFSFEDFIKNIHWEECLTNIIVAEQRERLQASANKP